MPTASPSSPSRLRRLPGRTPTFRSSRAAARTQLWLDDGQLIQESVRGYTQEIQRFALTDLQAVQIRRTVRGLVYNVILIVSLALLWLFTVAIAKGGPGRTVQLTGGDLAVGLYIAVPFVVLLLINSLRGPTCRTVLTTALGPQPLPSLCRMRVARRALDAIIAKVDPVQGSLAPDEAVRQVDRAHTPNAPATTRPGDNR